MAGDRKPRDRKQPIDPGDIRVIRAAQRLRELEISGITLPEILGGGAGAAFVRDYCDGDPDIASTAFALVHAPNSPAGRG